MERQMAPQTGLSRRTVASYASYAEAQRAIDYLSDQNFPVQRTAIVAEGLRFVEQVTGRLTYGRALINGAISGALTGAFVGLIFSFFSLVPAVFSFLLYGLITGAIIGAIFGLVAYALSGGQRDFSSITGMQAERYNVMVDDDVADEAARLLQGMSSQRSAV